MLKSHVNDDVFALQDEPRVLIQLVFTCFVIGLFTMHNKAATSDICFSRITIVTSFCL